LDKGGYIAAVARPAPLSDKDGYVCALIYNNKHWTNFFQAIGVGDTDHRPALRLGHHAHSPYQRDLCRDRELFKTRTTAEWTKLLDEATSR